MSNNDKRLPKVKGLSLLKCVKVVMNNDKEYIVKENDIVAIQFVRDEQILIRKGRIKDLVIINNRELSTPKDNVSRIILDCSEQFSVKVIEINFKDIIAIGGIDDEFEDYSDRKEELDTNDEIHVSHGGLCTDKNCNNHHHNNVTKKGIAIRK